MFASTQHRQAPPPRARTQDAWPTENEMKTNENQHAAPSKQPLWNFARAIWSPHGAPLTPKQPSRARSSCSQALSTAKLHIQEPKRKMHGQRENVLKTNENQHVAPSKQPSRTSPGPSGALMEPCWPPRNLPKAHVRKHSAPPSSTSKSHNARCMANVKTH